VTACCEEQTRDKWDKADNAVGERLPRGRIFAYQPFPL
jgi:YD repeat-containing protein